MKEALVAPGTKVQIVDSPVPQPNDDQVVIKVVVSGSNPKDWKLPEWFNAPKNQGDDIAGTIYKVGANVSEFKPGDRVAAFHEIGTPGGSYAEYAVAPQNTTFHLPPKTTFEEGAAIPLAANTAIIGLYRELSLPQPWTPAEDSIPLVIWGASGAVGSYTVQLARRSNIHPLICVVGKSQAHVESLIDRSKGDTLVDYRDGESAVIEKIMKAAGTGGLHYAFDAISENGSYQTLGKVLAPGGRITTVWPVKEEGAIPSNVTQTMTLCGGVHKEAKDLGFVFARYLTKGLQEGWFKAQPQVVIPGGLWGIQSALDDLKAGKAHATKYVFRISETGSSVDSQGGK